MENINGGSMYDGSYKIKKERMLFDKYLGYNRCRIFYFYVKNKGWKVSGHMS